jgi:HSP20 family molecular chaperone IbpA
VGLHPYLKQQPLLNQRGGRWAMTRLSLFNSPLLLGFEQFEQALDRISKTASDGYPPYNVEQVDEHRLRITLAVAGFGADDLQIQIEDNQLVVRGKQQDDKDKVYLHRGIAARQFQRSFVLADGIEVARASLDNGLLHIDLERLAIEPDVRTVRIETLDGGSDGGPAIEGKVEPREEASGHD